MSAVNDGVVEKKLAMRATWYRLVRRSFGIPDMVSDELATKVLHNRLGAEFEGSMILEDRWSEAGGKILDAVLTLGSNGELDDLLLPEDLARHVVEPGRVPPAIAAFRVESQSGLSGAAETAVRIHAAVELILTKVQMFSGEHPFETPEVLQ